MSIEIKQEVIDNINFLTSFNSKMEAFNSFIEDLSPLTEGMNHLFKKYGIFDVGNFISYIPGKLDKGEYNQLRSFINYEAFPDPKNYSLDNIPEGAKIIP
jgi:hypothetical protein